MDNDHTSRSRLYHPLGRLALFEPEPRVASVSPVQAQTKHRRTQIFALACVAFFIGVSSVVLAYTTTQQAEPIEPVQKPKTVKIVEGKGQPKVPPPTKQEAKSSKVIAEPPVTRTAVSYIDEMAAATTIADVARILNEFGKPYNMQTTMEVPPSVYGGYTFAGLTENDVPNAKLFGQIFITEWAQYPDDWLRQDASSPGPTLVLAAKVIHETAGERGGIYDNGTRIYISVPYIMSYPDSDYSYTRAVIHHEAGHFMTAILYGSAYNTDLAWTSHNPPGFMYGNTSQGSGYYHPLPGFVSQYALSNVAEDQAEIFSYLMVDQYYPALAGWLTSDPALNNKANILKEDICIEWQAMCGTYFESLHN